VRSAGYPRRRFGAAEFYLDELAGHSLTRQIGEALQTAGTDESSPAAVTAGRRRLAEDNW
jgi:hypothetical protein